MSSATAQPKSKIRVVVAKPGLDGHDRGAKIIARALRDAGMEVIYTGLHQTPEQIVETVIQEDADAVGLSILSGAHMTLVPRVVALLREQGIDDVVVTVGGTIPAEDIPELKQLGVAEVFTPGAPTQAIVDFIREAIDARPSERASRQLIDSSVNRRTGRITGSASDRTQPPPTDPRRSSRRNEDMRPGEGGPGRRRREADRSLDGAYGPQRREEPQPV